MNSLSVALAVQINLEHSQVISSAKKAVYHAVRAGELLLQVKTQLKHGEWLPWLKTNCDLSERTAQAYMRLAIKIPKLDDANAKYVADLPLRKVLGLLAEPQRSSTDKEESNPYKAWLAFDEKLETVRDKKLYLESHKDFEDYLSSCYGLTLEQARTDARKIGDPVLRVRASVLAQIVDLVPGIRLGPTGIEYIPERLAFETWSKVLRLFQALPCPVLPEKGIKLPKSFRTCNNSEVRK